MGGMSKIRYGGKGTSLVMFISNYFICFNAIINGIVFCYVFLN